MKKCPYCAEEIKEEAVKCIHCKKFLKENLPGKVFGFLKSLGWCKEDLKKVIMVVGLFLIACFIFNNFLVIKISGGDGRRKNKLYISGDVDANVSGYISIDGDVDADVSGSVSTY